MSSPRLLVVSLGNPFPKYKNLHSAGHFALDGLRKVFNQPAFREISFAKEICSVSVGAKYTLIRSPTFMNDCGPFVSKIWKDMAKENDGATLSLAIVHDELENEFGDVRLRAWERSHRGHNGVKSVKKFLHHSNYPESHFARVTIGIGRPAERDTASVSRYVLDKISAEQRQVLEEQVPWEVSKRLAEFENDWTRQIKKI